MKRTTVITALDAVTATTTSSEIDCRYACRAGFLFKRADHSSGSTEFTVEGSVDGTNWTGISVLQSNATNANTQNITRVSTVTLSSNTTSYVSLDLEAFPFLKLRVKATETTDGTHSAYVLLVED